MAARITKARTVSTSAPNVGLSHRLHQKRENDPTNQYLVSSLIGTQGRKRRRCVRRGNCEHLVLLPSDPRVEPGKKRLLVVTVGGELCVLSRYKIK